MNAGQAAVVECAAIGLGMGSAICIALLNIGAKLFRIARALEKLANDE